MREPLGKIYRCWFCGERYEIDYYDNDRTHQRYCGGDCQYAGEVLPDYIKQATGEEKESFKKELERLNLNYADNHDRQT